MARLDAPIRNVDLDAGAPVSELPAEAIEIVLDRGSLSDWRLLAAEIRHEPWGRLARIVEEIVSWDEHYGVDRIMAAVLQRARAAADAQARREYADEIRRWRLEAGLTLREMAARAGTSESRLSAYENARVAPTTVVLGRLRRALHLAAR